MKYQKLVNDQLNPFGPPIRNRFKNKEKSVYKRRTDKIKDDVCFSLDNKQCTKIETMY